MEKERGPFPRKKYAEIKATKLQLWRDALDTSEKKYLDRYKNKGSKQNPAIERYTIIEREGGSPLFIQCAIFSQDIRTHCVDSSTFLKASLQGVAKLLQSFFNV